MIVDRITFQIKEDCDENAGLHIDAAVTTGMGAGYASIRHTHTNVTLIRTEEEILYKSQENGSDQGTSEERKQLFSKMGLEDMLDYVDDIPAEVEQLAKDAIRMNTELSNIGIKKPIGLGVGFTWYGYSQRNGDPVSYMSARTAGATDARMFGVLIPAMSVVGSGNQGIAATMPIIAYAQKKGVDQRLLIKSVVLSLLLTINVTYRSRRLSATCGCATKAGVGASAGLAYYMSGGDINCCKGSIQNFVSTMTGVICGGANYGCALCAAETSHAVFQSALLALNHREIPQTSGILGKSHDDTIRNLAKIIDAMVPLDKTIVEIIKSK
jgi:L-cysteine desulfidase